MSRQASKASSTSIPSIKLYPNPANTWVVLQLPFPEEFTNIRVSDMMGRVLWQTQIEPGQKERRLNLEELSSGIYLIEIENHTYQKKQRLLIER